MERRVMVRPAERGESRNLAELTMIAGDGVFEYLLENLVDCLTPLELLAGYFAADNPTYCWRNAAVAEHEGQLVGMILSYPFREFMDDGEMTFRDDRQALVEVFNRLPCPESYYIGAMAVAPGARGFGVGGALLGYAVEKARGEGFRRLSLHVMQQNEEALRLYLRHGFREEGRKLLPEIAHLRHHGLLLLMARPV